MRSIRILALALVAGLRGRISNDGESEAEARGVGSAAQIAKDLHQTAVLLNQANHDYDGYRAKAVEMVHKAIKKLEPSVTRAHPKTAAAATVKPAVATTPKPAVKEDQKISDEQLTKALQQLKTLHVQLSAMTGTHHQQAAADVAAAMDHLKTALQIK